MKKPFFSILLALAPCMAAAEEAPQFIVTATQLTPDTPAWVDTDEFRDDTESAMYLKLAAKYQIAMQQPEKTRDAKLYAVNEHDDWDDWEEDTTDSAPALICAHFDGTLRDAKGKELPLSEDAAEDIALSDGVLYWELSTSQLPDTMQLQIDGTLSLTILEKGDTSTTTTITLKTTANNYAWASMEGYTLTLTIDEVEEEEDDWGEDEEDEADFDTIDDSEIHAPVPQTTDEEKHTNKLVIEGEDGLLDAIRAIIIIAPDGTETLILKDKVIDEDEESIIITDSNLTPQHQYRLELYTNKTTHSYKLHQPLYLNGVPN